MPHQNTSLVILIETERSLHHELTLLMLQHPDDSERVDVLATRHREAVVSVLETTPGDGSELLSKTRFVFDLLRRSYDDPYFEGLEETMITDIESVLGGQNKV